jgi:circadian clock protein KaiB
VNQTAARWSLTLYVSGASPRSTEAIENVRRICDEHLQGVVDLKVVDVREDPALVIADDVVAVPTLVKRMPAPLRQLVGDLSDPHRVISGLDLPLSLLTAESTGEPDATPGDTS